MNRQTTEELTREMEQKRKEKGLTRVRVANDIGVSVQAIRMWERGEATPRAKNQDKIREWLRNEPRSVNWDSLKRCVKHREELWNSRRVHVEIEGYAESHMRVETKGEYQLLKKIIDAAKQTDNSR